MQGLLLAEKYGEFTIIRSTTLLFADFVGFSFGVAATKYIAQYFGHDNDKVKRLMGAFLILWCNSWSVAFFTVVFCCGMDMHKVVEC